jgi:signal transduction histidine kinase
VRAGLVCQNCGFHRELKTETDAQRRNVNDCVREALISSLQSDNKQLMIRIDKDALDLATAEERLRDLSTELILADEQEQRRIAREMHDQLGQDLTALKMLIGRAKAAEADEAKNLLTRSQPSLRNAFANHARHLQPTPAAGAR